MSRIVRQAPSIKIVITKGPSQARTILARTRQMPNRYHGNGRITFGGITYDFSIVIDDTGTSVNGVANFTIIGDSMLHGQQSEIRLSRVLSDGLYVTASWGDIPLPSTSATAAITLTAERNDRDFAPGGAHSSTPIVNSSWVVAGSATAGSDGKRTQCESHGWPVCCPKVEEGHLIIAE